MMKPGTSLKTALSRNYILIGLLPMLVLGLASQLILSRGLVDEMKRRNHTLATSISRDVQTFLQEPLSLMYQVRDVLSTKDLLAGHTIGRYLNSVVTNHPILERVQYLDQEGKILSTVPLDADDIESNPARPHFSIVARQQGKTVWSSTFISRHSGSPSLILSIPMDSGLTVAYLNLEALSTMIAKLSGEHQFAVLTDDKGMVLGDLTPLRVQQRIHRDALNAIMSGLRGNESTIIVRDQGVKMLASAAPVPLTGWQVVVIQHYNDTFAPLTHLNRTILLGVLIIALAAVAAALLVAKSSVSQLLELINDVQRVADGKYMVSPSRDGYSEIQQLRDKFTSMAKAILLREQNFRESERQYRDLVDTIPHGIQESDLSGMITFTNAAYNRLFECDVGIPVGHPIWATAVNRKKMLELQAYYAYLVKEQPEPTPYQTSALTYHGNSVEIQIDWRYNRDAEGNLIGFISVITDISEKKLLEESLRHSQKMEAVGTLAGGIAHDFNNILSAILGFSEIILDSLPPGSPAYEDQQQIIKASHRAKDLIQHLLVFSRKKEQGKSPVIIGHIVTEAMRLLRASLPSTITFDLHIDQNTGVIEADPTQIHQVIINLCTNAAHAMEHKDGILTVSLQKLQLTEKDPRKPPELPPGEYARIAIADTGHGIETEHLQRIFEPFFTTKATGEGTGMGLAVVHGIVANHNGAITVESEIGRGTEFTVYLPLVNLAALEESQPETVVSGNREHILIVDDEKPIAMFTSSLLERNGYTTTAVTDSREALRLFEENTDLFDLVITDQTMPGMTGFELSRKILALRPDIPILLCTGFSSVISGEKAAAAGITEFIMKPISKKTLYQKVSTLLGIAKPAK